MGDPVERVNEPPTLDTGLPQVDSLAHLSDEYIEAEDARVTKEGTWKQAAQSGGHDGGHMFTTDDNAKATLTFIGKAVRVVTKSGAGAGVALIKLDNKEVARDDQYASDPEVGRVVYEIEFPTQGEHTISIEKSGNKNPSATGTALNLDYFRVYRDPLAELDEQCYQVENEPVVTEHMKLDSSSAGAEGGHMWSNDPNARVSLTESFQAVRVYTKTGGGAGIAAIDLDEQQNAGEDDQYSASPTFNRLAFQHDFGQPGRHTIVIRPSGKKNEAASAAYLNVDQICVYRPHRDEVVTPDPEPVPEPNPDTTPTSTPTETNNPEPVEPPAVTPGADEVKIPEGLTETCIQAENEPVERTGEWGVDDTTSQGEGGAHTFTNDAAARASLTFTGKAVKIVTKSGAGAGIAYIDLDGKKDGEDDQYAATAEYGREAYKKVFDTTGKHTVAIYPSGKKNEAASNTFLNLDYFCYYTEPATDPGTDASTQPPTDPDTTPTAEPGTTPTAEPGTDPSTQPSTTPSTKPSTDPSANPSVEPSTQPSTSPSVEPSTQPSTSPSTQPSTGPGTEPSTQPSNQPSTSPSTPTPPSSAPSTPPSTTPPAKPGIKPPFAPDIVFTIPPFTSDEKKGEETSGGAKTGGESEKKGEGEVKKTESSDQRDTSSGHTGKESAASPGEKYPAAATSERKPATMSAGSLARTGASVGVLATIAAAFALAGAALRSQKRS